MALLASVDVFRKQLNIPETTADGELLLYLEAASNDIEEFCDQPIAARQITIERRLWPGNAWVLIHFPIISIDQVAAYDDEFSDATVLEAGTYAHRGGRLVLASGVHDVYYRVTLTVGYPPLQIPAKIKLACLELATLYARKFGVEGIGSSTIGIRSVSKSNPAGGNTTTTFEDQRDKILERLGGYRVVSA